jgi:hypothetical protein
MTFVTLNGACAAPAVKTSDYEARFALAQADRVNNGAPWALLGALHHQPAEFWEITSVYRIWRTKDEKRYWLVRRLSSDGLGKTRWADSRRCPALEGAVARLADPPNLNLDALRSGEPPSRNYMADGATYSIWTTSALQPDGFGAELRITSNAGRIAEIGRAFDEALAACWRDRRSD